MKKDLRGVGRSSIVCPCDTFTHETYLPIIGNDAKNAVGRIIVVTPFATTNGTERWLSLLKSAIARGVHVCIFLQEPTGWANRNNNDVVANKEYGRMNQLNQVVQVLQGIGVHVTLRPKLHEKMFIVDDHILWDGSLNFLSHFDTTERLHRWNDLSTVAKAMVQHDLNRCPAQSAGVSTETRTKRVAEQIAERRVLLGLTQSDLAKRLRTRQSLISEIESGKRPIRTEVLEAICDELKVDVVLCPSHMTTSVKNFMSARAGM